MCIFSQSQISKIRDFEKNKNRKKMLKIHERLIWWSEKVVATKAAVAAAGCDNVYLYR